MPEMSTDFFCMYVAIHSFGAVATVTDRHTNDFRGHSLHATTWTVQRRNWIKSVGFTAHCH
jgi:hypothetical protein